MKRVARLLALALLAAPQLAAQEQFFSEVMEVRVTNVDVVVTDKEGKPVHGLTKDDFELYEGRRKREISNFLEIQEAPDAALKAVDEQPPAELAEGNRRRQIAVFVDDAVLHPLRRNLILEELRTFLERNLRPGDEVMIAAWGEALKLELEPTRDRSKIASAVGRLAQHTTRFAETEIAREKFHRQLIDLINTYANRIPPEKPPYSLGIYEARTFGMQVEHSMRQRVNALKSVIASLRGAPGRKVLVFLTERFTSNPAEEAFRYVESVRDKFDTTDFARVPNALQEMRDFEITSLITDVADAANSSGITMYAIDGSGKEGMMDTGNASESFPIAPNGVSVTGWTTPTLGAIAAETGGVALVGSTNYRLAFDTISNDLASYYSLGFQSSEEAQDVLHPVEVKLKKRGYTLRTRRAVIQPSVWSEMNDAVSAYLFRTPPHNDLEITAAAGRRATTSGKDIATIPVTITIPTGKLTLLPQGTELTGNFSIFAAFVKIDGQVSKVARQPQSFRFPAESLSRRKAITVKLDVTADMTTEGISIGVMDDASRATGFASVKVQ